jgi:UPF0716 protein FxsA
MFARIFLLFIIVPLIELFLFLLIGRYIGILPTFGIILLTGILGAALARTQGMRALAKYQEAIAAGRLPHEAVIDGLLILVAGALLLTPGFLTDTIGCLLLAPPVRTLVRAHLEDSLRRRFRVVNMAETASFRSTTTGGANANVINVEAEVVESTAYRETPGRS